MMGGSRQRKGGRGWGGRGGVSTGVGLMEGGGESKDWAPNTAPDAQDEEADGGGPGRLRGLG